MCKIKIKTTKDYISWYLFECPGGVGVSLGGSRLFVEADGSQDRVHHGVGVAVGRRSAVFQVALLALGHAARDPHGAAAVGDPCKTNTH